MPKSNIWRERLGTPNKKIRKTTSESGSTQIKGYILAMAMLTFLSGAIAQVVLTEIMYDAAGNENYDEFIEIYNLGAEPVDMTAWMTSDGTAQDIIISIGEGTVLQANQFGIILDGGYLENSTYYDSLIPEEALRLTIDNATFGSYGLSNSTAETVSLINPLGTVTSSHTYTLGNEPGYSEEKIILDGGDDPDNWQDSESWNGTPGAPNSVSPDTLDLALQEIKFQPNNPQANQPVTARVKVENVGLQTIDYFSIILGIDVDGDGAFDPDEEFGEVESTNLTSGDTTWMDCPMPLLPGGLYYVMASSDFQDDNPENNVVTGYLAVGSSTGALIINELFYKPLPNQCEWIELYNPHQSPVNIAGWRFTDSNGLSDTSRHMVLPRQPLWIEPSSFAVLAQDSSVTGFSIPTGTALFVGGSSWPTLNNTGDSLMLFDIYAQPIDSVFYLGDWSEAENGVSLERICPSHPPNDPLNWADCVDPDNATPGRENSVLFHPSTGAQLLFCEPNPFSPDGDGRDDALFIRFNLPVATARVNLKIFDVRGRLVRWLMNNQPVGSATEVIWDGTHGNGVKARIGIYIVYLEALNATSGIIKSAKRTVVLAEKL
jgi:hypothetical protein